MLAADGSTSNIEGSAAIHVISQYGIIFANNVQRIRIWLELAKSLIQKGHATAVQDIIDVFTALGSNTWSDAQHEAVYNLYRSQSFTDSPLIDQMTQLYRAHFSNAEATSALKQLIRNEKQSDHFSTEFRQLVSQGADIDALLFDTALSGSAFALQQILRCHPTLEKQDSRGRTVLIYSCLRLLKNRARDPDLFEKIRLLVNYGASVTRPFSFLHRKSPVEIGLVIEERHLAEKRSIGLNPYSSELRKAKNNLFDFKSPLYHSEAIISRETRFLEAAARLRQLICLSSELASRLTKLTSENHPTAAHSQETAVQRVLNTLKEIVEDFNRSLIETLKQFEHLQASHHLPDIFVREEISLISLLKAIPFFAPPHFFPARPYIENLDQMLKTVADNEQEFLRTMDRFVYPLDNEIMTAIANDATLKHKLEQTGKLLNEFHEGFREGFREEKKPSNVSEVKIPPVEKLNRATYAEQFDFLAYDDEIPPILTNVSLEECYQQYRGTPLYLIARYGRVVDLDLTKLLDYGLHLADIDFERFEFRKPENIARLDPMDEENLNYLAQKNPSVIIRDFFQQRAWLMREKIKEIRHWLETAAEPADESLRLKFEMFRASLRRCLSPEMPDIRSDTTPLYHAAAAGGAGSKTKTATVD